MEFAKLIYSLGEKDRELVFDIVYIWDHILHNCVTPIACGWQLEVNVQHSLPHFL